VSEPHDPSPTSASPFAVRDLLADDMQDMQLRLLAGAAPIPGLAVACETHGMPPLSSRLASAMPAERPGRRLEIRLAPSTTLHGALIDIYGVGVPLLGASGVGKSESALELVLRGHRLVSDDVVVLRRVGAAINGAGPDERLGLEDRTGEVLAGRIQPAPGRAA